MIPALYLWTISFLQEKFLIYVKKEGISVTANLLHALVHISVCYYFIDILELDVLGLCYASMVSFTSKFLFLLIFSCLK